MDTRPPSVSPATTPPTTQNAAGGASGPQQCVDNIERLAQLSGSWRGLDLTGIAESVMDTLLEMLDLDFVGLRFSDTVHIFTRVGRASGGQHETDGLVTAVEEWLKANLGRSVTLSISGDPLRVVQQPLGEAVSMGVLVAGSRRPDFPTGTELLTLGVAATQATLAFREVRELSGRTPPVDMRAERPSDETLAEREWRLHLTVNTIPAMAWSARPDGTLDFSNQHFLDFVGLSASEMAGLGFYRIFHPDDMQHMVSSWQSIMSSKRGHEVESRIRRADGVYRWCALRQTPSLDSDGTVIKWYGVILDIEDRKRAEDALKATEAALAASERNLALTINCLPVLVWSARQDGSCDFVNQSWEDYAGVPSEKIQEWGFLDYYHPDDAAGMAEIWRRDTANSDSTLLKGRIRRHDGQYRWFLFAGRKFTDANGGVRWFGCNVDIEELQRAGDALRDSEQALRKNERQLQQIVNTIPAMVWSATPDGALDFWHENLTDFVGIPFEEIVGLGFYRIFHPDDVDILRAAWEQTVATKVPREVDGRVRRADGEYRWFSLRQNPLLDGEGNVLKWYGVIFEIEGRRRAEEELRRSQSDLAHVARMVTMGELAVSIAHEVNQPLMAIVTNAGTCLRWLDDNQLNVALARQAAQRIVQDGHRAGDIVASLQALARKSTPKIEPINLHAVVQDVLDLLGGELRRRSVTPKVDLAQGESWILGDSTQLQQVVLNLVMNAVEAMSDIPSGRRRLTIKTQWADDVAQVSLLDAGTGVRAEDREKIFDAFFSTKSEGLGMGLSICRSIVEAHGGRIWATENVPQGSVFSFTVPLARGTGADDQ